MKTFLKFYNLPLVILIVSWILMFVLGITTNSVVFYNSLIEGNFTFESITGFIMAWTWTNIMILCFLASLIGEFGRNKIKKMKDGEQLSEIQQPSFVAGLARGFFIYLFIISGQLIIAGSVSLPVFDNPNVMAVSPEQYFRLAGFVSLTGLLVGLNPVYLDNLLAKFKFPQVQ